MKIFFTLALAALLPTAGFAADARCAGSVVAAVAAGAAIEQDGANVDGLVSSTCKLWPHDRKVVLAALVFSGEGEDNKILVVSTVDAATGRVLSSYRNSVGEDSATEFGADSLAIDSAPYQLSPAVRAFGIRFTSSARGASCPDGIWSDELTLFVPRGKLLVPVLQGMAMSRSEARTGCFGGGAGRLVYDAAKLSIAMGQAVSHGSADLSVSARITRNEPGADFTGKPATERTILRFDGEQYRPVKPQPWWLLLFPLGV
jgi:hypothetical protein